MPKNRIIVTLGALVALLPILGFPSSWEAVFQVLAGLAIVLFSVWSTIDKKLKLQAKAQMRQARKVTDTYKEPEAVSPNPSTESLVPGSTPEKKEEFDSFGKRVTDFYPKTGQPGRRLSDLNPTIINPDETEI